MRNAIREYLNYSDEEKQDLWNTATFVFDTNVYLNLYRYTGKTRELLLSALSRLQERLWMPNQVAREYMKNRKKIILETNNQYDTLQAEAGKFIEDCRSSLKLDKNDNDLAELHEHIISWIDTSKKKYIAASAPNNDPILDQLLKIYENNVGSAFSDSDIQTIEAEGKKRYAAEIPPGYKDSGKQKGNNLNNIYGDYIVWKQILDYAASEKKDIILVTNDQKEDWWEIVLGQTMGPRIELKKEFFEQTSQRFHMYSMRGFITRFEHGNNVEVDSETIDEIEFFSKIIHHKTNRSELREYYNSFENDDEVRAAKIRFQIMKLENKNRKRLNQINYNSEKYHTNEMPESIESMIDNTIINMERDYRRIQQLQDSLLDCEYKRS